MKIDTLKTDRFIFTGLAIYILIVCLFGFLPSTLDPEIEWPISTMIHGIVTLLWMVLLVVQTGLIATKNTKLHVRLGKAGFVLILLMIPAAYFLARHIVYVGKRDISLGGGMDFMSIVFISIILMIGIGFRKKPDTHKRIMILGTMWFVGAAWARIYIRFFSEQPSTILNFALILFPFLLILIYDLVARRKVFPVTLIVPVLFMGSIFSITSFANTPKGNALLSMAFPIEHVEVNNLSIIGSALFENWDESIEFRQESRSENKWEGIIDFEDGEVRFLGNNDKKINWGGNSFPDGMLVRAGSNIPIKEGKYLVQVDFDKSTYSFVEIAD